MTLFLASVRDAAEAETARRCGADIIDLKDPASGALGAVEPSIAREAVAAIAGRVPISVTIGDVPMVPDRIVDAVLAAAACGAVYVKIGVFPGGDAESCFDRLAAVSKDNKLVVVAFADCPPTFDVIELAAAIGATGIMLDTMKKGSSRLTDHMQWEALAGFVRRGSAAGLSVGLAGSLRAEHVRPLLALKPDVLGFRGALCRESRSARLDEMACRSIRSLIPPAELRPARQEPMVCVGVPAL
jgi:dihydroneopterin aldolase